MKKQTLLSSIIFFSIIFALLTSCTQSENQELVDLTIDFNSKAKTKNSRDLAPSDDELTVFKFSVEGIGPNGKTFNLETTEESTQLCNLVKGKWDISVTGYNVNDEAIVIGDGTYYLFNTLSKVNITLNYIVGNGDIDIDLFWNENQADPDKVGIVTTYYKLDNNTFSEYQIQDTITYSAGHANVTTPLPAGNYILASKLLNGPTELSGLAEEVRVLANHTTTGSNTYIIGDTTLNYGINFTCNTHLPIKGVISAIPESIIENQEMTLTFTPTSIPDGYTADDLRYRWYFEGSLIEGEETNALTILPVKGDHRYDLFAYINGVSGTLGSTKIIISCSEN